LTGYSQPPKMVWQGVELRFGAAILGKRRDTGKEKRVSAPCLTLHTPLTHRLKQTDARRHRHVETAHRAGHRQLCQIVAMLTGQAAHPGAFRTHHDHCRHLEINLVQKLLSLTGGTDHPQPALLQLLESTREVGDSHQRNGFSGTAGYLAHGW